MAKKQKMKIETFEKIFQDPILREVLYQTKDKLIHLCKNTKKNAESYIQEVITVEKYIVRIEAGQGEVCDDEYVKLSIEDKENYIQNKHHHRDFLIIYYNEEWYHTFNFYWEQKEIKFTFNPWVSKPFLDIGNLIECLFGLNWYSEKRYIQIQKEIAMIEKIHLGAPVHSDSAINIEKMINVQQEQIPENIRDEVQELLTILRSNMKNIEQFGYEEKHMVKTLIEKDLKEIIHGYIKLSDKMKQKKEDELLKTLNTIKNTVSRLENKKTNHFDKLLLIANERYKM